MLHMTHDCVASSRLLVEKRKKQTRSNEIRNESMSILQKITSTWTAGVARKA